MVRQRPGDGDVCIAAQRSAVAPGLELLVLAGDPGAQVQNVEWAKAT